MMKRMILVLILCTMSACDSGVCPDGRSWSIPPGAPDEMVTLTNEARVEAGLPPLSRDTTLAIVAFNHSKDMACQNYFNHISLDGRNPMERVEEAGEDYANRRTTVRENIYIGTAGITTADAVEGWIASDEHRENLLSDAVTEIGEGVVRLEVPNIDVGRDGREYEYTTYWTAVYLGPNE